MSNIIRRSQTSSLFGNVLSNDITSKDRSKVNELRMDALLHRIHDNDNEGIFKVVVLGNSMTAGMCLCNHLLTLGYVPSFP